MSIFTKQERDIILDALAYRLRAREDVLDTGPTYSEVAKKVHLNSDVVSEVVETVEEDVANG